MDTCSYPICTICVSKKCFWVALEGYKCFCTSTARGIQDVLGLVSPGGFCDPIVAAFCNAPLTTSSTSEFTTATSLTTEIISTTTPIPHGDDEGYKQGFWILLSFILLALFGFLLMFIANRIAPPRRDEENADGDVNAEEEGAAEGDNLENTVRQRLASFLRGLGRLFVRTAQQHVEQQISPLLGGNVNNQGNAAPRDEGDAEEGGGDDVAADVDLINLEGGAEEEDVAADQPVGGVARPVDMSRDTDARRRPSVSRPENTQSRGGATSSRQSSLETSPRKSLIPVPKQPPTPAREAVRALEKMLNQQPIRSQDAAKAYSGNVLKPPPKPARSVLRQPDSLPHTSGTVAPSGKKTFPPHRPVTRSFSEKEKTKSVVAFGTVVKEPATKPSTSTSVAKSDKKKKN